MTADLIAFLRARLDEDEATARGAVSPIAKDDAWFVVPRSNGKGPTQVRSEPNSYGTTFSVARTAAHQAVHIARHDPARVLAEINAKRAIIERHGAEPSRLMSGVRICKTCSAPKGVTDHGCDTLRLLALPYASHPEWRLQWAPTAETL